MSKVAAWAIALTLFALGMGAFGYAVLEFTSIYFSLRGMEIHVPM